MPLAFPAATLDAVASFFGLSFGPRIAAFDKLLALLSRETAPAAAKLSEALDEIDRMLTALDAELVRYLEIRFGDAPPARADIRTLLELEAGRAKVRIEEARGHCSRIERIYEAHLKRWLHDALDEIGAQEIARIFDALGDADFAAVDAAERIDAFLSEHAEATLDRLLAGDPAGADQLVADARAKALDYRRALFRELAMLRRYQSAFAEAARSV